MMKLESIFRLGEAGEASDSIVISRSKDGGFLFPNRILRSVRSESDFHARVPTASDRVSTTKLLGFGFGSRPRSKKLHSTETKKMWHLPEIRQRMDSARSAPIQPPQPTPASWRG